MDVGLIGRRLRRLFVAGGLFALAMPAAAEEWIGAVGYSKPGRCCPQPSCCTPTIEGMAPDETAEPSLAPEPAPVLQSEQFASLAAPSISLADSQVGYIDTAIVGTNFRFRFEGGYDINRADRAEFLYTTWTTFGGGAPPPRILPDPDVDYYAMRMYYEQAIGCVVSVFAEVPLLFNDPSLTASHTGLGDMIAGMKLALIRGENVLLTAQVKNYIPTGNPNNWLTTDHYSIEPGLLGFVRLTDRLFVESELRHWISIGGADFRGQDYAGDVLRYGLGVSYAMYESCSGWRFSPVVEFVGWSVFDGQEFDTNLNRPVSADGDTIVNFKVGARLGNYGGGSLYAGWGHSMTHDRWYRDIWRLEWRRFF